MVLYNAATKELTAKIVYYGPGLGGKTTNLQVLHDRLEPGTRPGSCSNLSTADGPDDLLRPAARRARRHQGLQDPLPARDGAGPDRVQRDAASVVLQGADGIVFVADSQWTMLPKNLESWQNLKDNLKSRTASPFEDDPGRHPVQQARPDRHPLRRRDAGGARLLLVSRSSRPSRARAAA